MEAGNDFETLNRRIQRLEDIESIRSLKARYLNACDQQDPDQVRACFAEGKITIDVGHLGRFDDRDGFADLFRAFGCHDFVLDKHQGGNAEIEIIDDAHATGLWCLDYRNINTRDQTVSFVSLLYHDAYEKIGGLWKIVGARSEFKTALHCSYASGMLEALVAGHSVAAPPLQTTPQHKAEADHDR